MGKYFVKDTVQVPNQSKRTTSAITPICKILFWYYKTY